MAVAKFYETTARYVQSQQMADGADWLAVLCNFKGFKQISFEIKKFAFLFAFAFAQLTIMLIFAPASGLVAQLNSALDYGSRGYWFESSRGHKS